MPEQTPNHFVDLARIDVSAHTEKKNGLTYLSWAWAVDQLLRVDPSANWSFLEPQRWGDTVMVACAVTAFGKTMTMQLPVMDHRNKAIPSPDAFAVNTAMQRCLVKAIALHGLGLYIYAGEDLPAQEEPAPMPITAENLAYLTQLNELEKGKPLVATIFKRAGVDAIAMLKEPMATEAVAWARKKLSALAAPASSTNTQPKE